MLLSPRNQPKVLRLGSSRRVVLSPPEVSDFSTSKLAKTITLTAAGLLSFGLLASTQRLAVFVDSEVLVSESAGQVSLTAERFSQLETELRLEFATGDGTALAGEDYVSASGPLIFLGGESVKRVSIPLLDDCLMEEDKSFTVSLLRRTSENTTETIQTATVHIRDDERPVRIHNSFILPQSFQGYPISRILDQQGRLLVWGDAIESGQRRQGIIRLHANGGLNLSFDDSDLVTLLSSNYPYFFLTVAVQHDGKVLAAGFSGRSVSTPFLYRLLDDGSLDTNFHQPKFPLAFVPYNSGP